MVKEDLKTQVVAGLSWTSVSALVRVGCQVAQTAVLARLVGPRGYGVMAMAIIVISMAQAFTDGGISAAIIHRQRLSAGEQSSLYWLNVLLAASAFVITLGSIPLITRLFHEDRLGPIVFAAAFSLLLTGATKQFEVLLQRDLRFRELARQEMVGQFLSTAVSIPAAACGLGVWALVAGFLSSAIARAALLARLGLRSYRPTLRFAWHDTKSFLGFGAYQIGERLTNYIGSRCDQIIVGSLLGARDLGYYNLSFSLVLAPVSLINPVVTRVAFPVLSRIQTEAARLKAGYFTMVRALGLVSAGVLGAAALLAPTILPRFLGAQWVAAVPIFQVLCAASYFRSVGNPLGSLLLSRGRADLGFAYTLCVLPVAAGAAFMGGNIGGAIGVAVAVSLFHPLFCPPEYFFLIRRLLGPCWKDYVGSTCIPGLTAGVAFLIAYVATINMIRGSVGTVLCQVSAFLSLYFIASFLVNRQWLSDMLLKLRAVSAGCHGRFLSRLAAMTSGAASARLDH